jgi:hypothetical protein
VSDQFWGTIKHLGKTYAIVGPEGSVEAARKALGSIVAVEPRADAAPLPVAPLDASGGKPTAAPAVAGGADAAPRDIGAETFTRAAKGRFAEPKPGAEDKPASGMSKWGMVRAPKQEA